MKMQINMKAIIPKSFHPLWAIISVSLPVLIILLFFTSLYLRIGSLYSEKESIIALIIGIVLLVYGIILSLYAAKQWSARKGMHPVSGMIVLLINLSFLLFAFFNFEKIIPSNVPLWMYMGDNYAIYFIAMMMPGFVYGMSLILLWLTPVDKKQSVPLNIGLCIAIPLFWLLVFKVFIPLLNKLIKKDDMYSSLNLDGFFSIILLSVSAMLFIFFLIRVFILLSRQHPRFFNQGLKIPLVLVFPLLGLMLNNGAIKVGPFGHPIFGNFSHPLYYIIAITTALVLLLPRRSEMGYTRILLTLKLILFSYSVYFFIIFLPFLPLAIPLVLYFGTGLLILAPTGLLVYHIRSIREDMAALNINIRSWKNVLGAALLFLLLPLSMIVNMYADRVILYRALDNIYRPDYHSDRMPHVNPQRILSAFVHSELHRSRDIFSSSFSTPIITPIYNRIVFGYQTLSIEKRNILESIYLGHHKSYSPLQRGMYTPSSVAQISEVQSQTRYDESKKVYVSRLMIWMKNWSEQQQEFNTVFDLAPGAYISDFKLKIGDVLKQGLISDKKSALWVYEEITRPRTLDPAILYYLSRNRVQMRVFPLDADETRYAEMEIRHLQPISLELGKRRLNLGTGRTQSAGPEDSLYTYISPSEFKNLSQTLRPQKYHFIVDNSMRSTNQTKRYIENIKTMIRKNSLERDQYDIILTDAEFRVLNNQADWEKTLLSSKKQGGFYPGQVIRRLLIQDYLASQNYASVFILLTDDYNEAIFTHDLSEFAQFSPDTTGFYHMDSQSVLYLHPWTDQERSQALPRIKTYPVKMWPHSANTRVYLPIQFMPSAFIVDPQKWEKGAVLNILDSEYKDLDSRNLFHTMEMESLQLIQPSLGNKLFNKLIYSGISTGIMNKFTSYIVLENEAQEKSLLEKQRRILSGKQELDASEQRRQMSEPSVFVLIIMFGVLVLLKLRKSYKAGITLP